MRIKKILLIFSLLLALVLCVACGDETTDEAGATGTETGASGVDIPLSEKIGEGLIGMVGVPYNKDNAWYFNRVEFKENNKLQGYSLQGKYDSTYEINDDNNSIDFFDQNGIVTKLSVEFDENGRIINLFNDNSNSAKAWELISLDEYAEIEKQMISNFGTNNVESQFFYDAALCYDYASADEIVEFFAGDLMFVEGTFSAYEKLPIHRIYSFDKGKYTIHYKSDDKTQSCEFGENQITLQDGKDYYRTYFIRKIDGEHYGLFIQNDDKETMTYLAMRPELYAEPFVNVYGDETTKCAHEGCDNYIARYGDTNCCEEHSNECGKCGRPIDEDAEFCMQCLEDEVKKQKEAAKKAGKGQNGKEVTDSYERGILIAAAKSEVKKQLKVPDSAKFSHVSDISITKVENQYVVESWVRAKNALGAELTNYYTVIFNIVSGEGKSLKVSPSTVSIY